MGPPSAPSGMQSALARLQHLQDPMYETLARGNQLFASLEVNYQWAHMKNTIVRRDWLPLLNALGCDQQNVQALCQLAQQGRSGRVEANRLLYTWASPAPGDRPNYVNAPQVYQAPKRKGGQRVHRQVESHQDFQAWVPGHTLGPYWQPVEWAIPDWAKPDMMQFALVTPPQPPHGAEDGQSCRPSTTMASGRLVGGRTIAQGSGSGTPSTRERPWTCP